MKLVFFGTPDFAVPSLERLLAEPNFEVLAVVTQPDKPRGRGKALIPSPVKAVGIAAGLPCWQPRRIKKDRATLAQLQAYGADAFVVVAYGQILSAEILAMPRLGCINGHGSLLPAYRGAAPIQWSLYHGETVTGMTTMLMDVGMDTGPMLLKSTLPIGLLDHAQTVGEGLARQCGDLLVETLSALDQGTVEPVAQDPEQASYAPLIEKSDYRVDWQRGAIALHNQIRGFYPHCQGEFRGNPLKILTTIPLVADVLPQLPAPLQTLAPQWQDLPIAEPGTVVQILKKSGPVVQTGEGLLLLTQVQPPGKRPQSGSDFANGMRLGVGDRFV
ncbi:methionyl-tRNA formyltransferase [Spirulina sp. CCNP1310]|uniref:methionyl-tRNA formyltransferase n=1 Tax=Spirulina sp. CCNP1310 TaxID=3110249 RepID=UPI002B1ECF9A|nr:methionyl-tRNA formyltransferase [Spirulina sp. CCNP1310]MEA5421071.1 methionyl-tRNA formyltransferase [Spirulina sp. CCNP1310]